MNHSSSPPEPDFGRSRPTIFRFDYPEEAANDWAVLWEVEDEIGFELAEGQPSDPTLVSREWMAISPSDVVDVVSMR